MIKIFKNCTIEKVGRKWIEIKSNSSQYVTNTKVLKDSMNVYDFKNASNLVLEHLQKEKFINIADENVILDLTIIDLTKYCHNAINRKYIYNFLIEYKKFQETYKNSKELKVKNTIEQINELLVKFSSENNIRFPLLETFNPHIKLIKEIKKVKRSEKFREAKKTEALKILNEIFRGHHM